jgi:hypothetical protein
MEIEEGNELISEFMGYQVLNKRYQVKSYNSSNEYYWAYEEGEIVCDADGNEVNDHGLEPFVSLDELPFFDSWDWLMPAVEKLGTWFWIDCEGNGSFDLTYLMEETMTHHLRMGEIGGVWECVVEGIKYYNESK